ncbi:MAG: hypothetical protein F6K63_31125 [Moorea sp. SIO1G6]|nr:hypothetical protein [Moorena sp. SIO1G6]NET68608.1 hypothetical protein [Moorena sp. SIO1G6]
MNALVLHFIAVSIRRLSALRPQPSVLAFGPRYGNGSSYAHATGIADR